MDRERWQDFNLSWQHHLDTGAKIADRWHKSADELTQMMLNTSFVINAGGIVGVPALHQFLIGDGTALPWERTAAILFFLGIVAAGLSGIFTIINYRALAENVDDTYRVDAQEIEEKWTAEGEFAPSAELKKLQEKPRAGASAIRFTFYLGWLFGLLSYGAFLAGGIVIAFSAGSHPQPAAINVDPPKSQ